MTLLSMRFCYLIVFVHLPLLCFWSAASEICYERIKEGKITKCCENYYLVNNTCILEYKIDDPQTSKSSRIFPKRIIESTNGISKANRNILTLVTYGSLMLIVFFKTVT
ncbi:uncharacterized protein LOC134257079 [Saccostrea cucullata]|uniref:uncharacterized protein LOC134257079 n=1 Tax=Saccostrea cuccullata TaxID=36930 RepID=UPI002ED615B6